MSLLLRPSNFFSQYILETPCLVYKRSNSFVHIFVAIVSFSKLLRQDLSYEAENWHALSHE